MLHRNQMMENEPPEHTGFGGSWLVRLAGATSSA